MAIAKYNQKTNSNSLDDSDVPYHTALPNSCNGPTMAQSGQARAQTGCLDDAAQGLLFGCHV
jgi:hypothetical protein